MRFMPIHGEMLSAALHTSFPSSVLALFYLKGLFYLFKKKKENMDFSLKIFGIFSPLFTARFIYPVPAVNW